LRPKFRFWVKKAKISQTTSLEHSHQIFINEYVVSDLEKKKSSPKNKNKQVGISKKGTLKKFLSNSSRKSCNFYRIE
jgi:hypothetical protein